LVLELGLDTPSRYLAKNRKGKNGWNTCSYTHAQCNSSTTALVTKRGGSTQGSS